MSRNVAPSPVETARAPGTRGVVGGFTRLYLVDDGEGRPVLSDVGPDDFKWVDDGHGRATPSDSATANEFTAYETSSGTVFVQG